MRCSLLVKFFCFFLAFFWLTGVTASANKTRQTFVIVQPGDTLYSLFKKQQISGKTLATLSHLPAAAQPMKQLHVGQKMRFTFDQKNTLESYALSLNRTQTLVIFRAGSRFIARIERAGLRVPKIISTTPLKAVPKVLPKKVAPPPSPVHIKVPSTAKVPAKPHSPAVKAKIPPPKPAYPPLHYTGFVLHTSLYTDAKKRDIPPAVIQQFIQIFSLQVNFRDTHAGDKVVLAYDNNARIVAAKFTQGRRTYAAIRYVNAQGVVEYFSPTGEGMKKAFNRFPVKYTHINSLFNMHRMHPVTHVVRPHTGVDLAAPIGSPIYSIGDGRITFIGWGGAYGNIVTIQHDEKYSSRYAHLLRFANGLSAGSYVKRGQLIGFLGQSGNATGPHIHFEIRIYNRPMNPLTVPLPYSSAIPPSQRTAFRARANLLMSALNNYSLRN